LGSEATLGLIEDAMDALEGAEIGAGYTVGEALVGGGTGTGVGSIKHPFTTSTGKYVRLAVITEQRS
jgi:hypothetical protein